MNPKQLGEVRPMKTRPCVWLATLVVCVITSDAAAGKESAEPKRDSQILVEPAQLQKQLDDLNLRILDARSTEEYSKGHIPGAVRVDVGDWKTLATADGGLHDAKGWAEKIGSLGITSKSHVVVYGGPLPDSTRIWWLLKYVGVENASLLDGGWESWLNSGRPAETSTPKFAATEFKPKFQADRLEEIATLKKSLESDKLKVVDTRSDTEFAGGRIPGSTHLEWKELVAEDGRLKTKTQLLELFRKRGIMPDETAVCY
jgi:thiosulfate/3-mercaptopyruvate sulfurtransferase